MNAESRAAEGFQEEAAPFDFEAVFRLHYARVARLIARLVKDPGRAEELAVEVFWQLWRNPKAQGDRIGGWLYRTAVHAGLYELRRQARRERFAHLFRSTESPPDPEQVHAAAQEQKQVRAVLARMNVRQAELLLLRNNGLSYEELAAALKLNAASVGTLLSRAQQAFRKEYVKQFGGSRNER